MTLLASVRSESRQFSAIDILPFIKSPKAENPIELKSLAIKVSVNGIYAETTQEMHFYNPNKRIFSGELVFPLPDNAVVCGYALDIDGTMRDGVIVPKQEARKILESEERKGADPGLIEQVQGNVYKTRIYPFPAKGTRTVKITYMTELTVNRNEAAYHLPLSHASQLDEVSVRVEVAQGTQQPQITGGQGNMTLTEWRQSWVAEARLTRGLVTEDLLIRLPDLPEELMMVEQTPDNERVFCISKVIETEQETQQWAPDKIGIVWDGSGSRSNIDQDLELLKILFGHWHNITVDVTIFRNQISEKKKVFAIRESNSDELVSFLKNLAYDGATDLSLLDFRSFSGDADCEAWLLFSDGMDTLGGSLPVVSDNKIYAINSQRAANAPFMQHLADESGGAYINLLNSKPNEASIQIISGISSVRVIQSEGCKDVYIKETSGRSVITGKLTAESGSITLQHPDGFETELIITSENLSPGSLVARQWAGQHIHRLALNETPQSEQLLLLARRFGLVSPGTSLLVLEDVEQYIAYGVEPPASLPEMRKQYWQSTAHNKKNKEKQQRKHLEHVVSLWEKRIEWWEKEYDGIYLKPTKRTPETQRPVPRFRRTTNENGGLSEGIEFDCSMAAPFPETLGDFCLSHAEPSMAFPSTNDNEGDNPISTEASISIKPWNPDTPYLEKLKEAEQSDAYETYLQLRLINKNSPSFFLDCGDYFLEQSDKKSGIRILSNLLEMGLEDVALMRVYGWRLQQADEFDAAIAVFERVLILRDDEPQSYRDLALVLSARGEQDGNEDDIARAIKLFYEVAVNKWDRFPEIELIALMELNRLISLADKKLIDVPEYFDRRLINHLDLDLRISMSWDADLTDVDLHVFEPTGEHAYYGHNLTATGGLVSRDFREGYGPEEYVLRRAVSGKYKIKAHYYGSHQQTLVGPCTVLVNVFTNYGRIDEKKQVLTLRLEESGDEFLVGEIIIGDKNRDRNNPPGANLSIETFRKIKAGMSMTEVLGLVGRLHQMSHDEGDGILMLEYILEGDVKIRVDMKYVVIGVSSIMDGAVIDIL